MSEFDRAERLLVRPALPNDLSTLFDLITALADYENLRDHITGSPEALADHLFGSQPYIEAVVAESGGEVAGFALFFTSYSSFITQPGFYLEDLFVLPAYRGRKLGRALLSYLAGLAIERQYRRLEWSVLDWNQPAIGFYQRIGSRILEDARVCRMSGEALPQLANRLVPAPAANDSTNPAVTLRPPLPTEINRVFELVQANIAHDGTLHLFQGQADRLAEHLFGEAYVEAVIAQLEPPLGTALETAAGEIVGIALFYKTYSTFLTKPGLFVEDLFVLPDYRSLGIGTKLLAYLAQQVIERSYGRLEWRVRIWNDRAIAFYTRLGAEVLPDWRVCQLTGSAMAELADSSSLPQA
jgi:ribosomal protein S18 acetylase RimI-like enzyme